MTKKRKSLLITGLATLLLISAYLFWPSPQLLITLPDPNIKKLYAPSYIPINYIPYSSGGLISPKVDVAAKTFTPFFDVEALNTPNQEGRRLSIVFVGDILPHADVQISAFANGGYDSLFSEGVKTLLKEVDLTIGNLETVVDDSQTFIGTSLTYNASSSLLKTLKRLGFDLLMSANNHSMDLGDESYRNTISAVYKHQMTPLGSQLNSKGQLFKTRHVFLKQYKDITKVSAGVKALNINAMTYRLNTYLVEVEPTNEFLNYIEKNPPAQFKQSIIKS